ncbi:MAG: FtsW/RodA/SpoVE family cell cycle protein [Oscillospiraceae bacterium]|nr:FtsW/RodA/SpoVE family cell cycle protein [Oscillospiraceae bacterium]
MYRFWQEFKRFFRKGDTVLLLLCMVITSFGIVMISSATNHMGSTRFIIIQLAAAGLGILMYAIISSIDADVLAERRTSLVMFNLFMLLLLIPFGTDNNSGNRSWLDIPLIPFDIQPAEVCKMFFIVTMASVMKEHQSGISGIKSILHMVFHLGLLVGLNMALSRDAGVSLIFVFIFIGMAFAGGVSLLWYLLAGGAIAAAWPFIWNVMDQHQRNRILILFDPTVDPLGIDERFHSKRSLLSLTGGGTSGQGLFEGIRTQSGALPAQHTDYIFSAIGEELGFIGCALVLLAEFLVVARCIQIGNRTNDYMRRMICYGAASALIFQVLSNVGMCIGVTPVIGLTLPFISYGGSSIVSLYAMLGLVSGVHARPESEIHELYIRPRRY